jgi:hypothetical protein
VHWIIARAEIPPQDGWRLVLSEPKWNLFRLDTPASRASVVTTWRVLPDDGDALAAVMEAGFDPQTEAVLSEDPGIAPTGPGPPASAEYRSNGTQASSISVDSPTSGVLLVRNVFDRYWHATVDGRSVPVLRADGLVQAVAVPAGTSEVVLRYDDPWIGYGLAVQLAAWIVVLGAIVVLRRRESRSAARPQEPTAIVPVSRSEPPSG